MRVVDDVGGVATLRRSLLVVPEWPLSGAHTPPVSLEFAGQLARPGTPVRLAATNLEAGATYAWDADGDGAFDDGTGQQIQFTYATPGEYTVRVKASTRGRPRRDGDGFGARGARAGTGPVLRARGRRARRQARALRRLGRRGRRRSKRRDAHVRPRRRRRLRRTPGRQYDYYRARSPARPPSP